MHGRKYQTEQLCMAGNIRPGSYAWQEVSDRAAMHGRKYQTGQLCMAGSIRPGSYAWQEVSDRAAMHGRKYQTKQPLPLLYVSWILARHQDQMLFPMKDAERVMNVFLQQQNY
jgi:hypothetical protein